MSTNPAPIWNNTDVGVPNEIQQNPDLQTVAPAPPAMAYQKTGETPIPLTQHMIGPGGTAMDVPVHNVAAALKDGGRLAVKGTGPGGSAMSVPMDKAEAAVKDGFQINTPLDMQPVNTVTGGAAVGDIGSGVIKGAGETAHTVGRIVNAVTGDNIGSLPTSFDEPDYLQSQSGSETAGKVGENIAEFALGDEALKGLNVADRIGIAGKLVKLSQDSPYIARLLEAGVNATRYGLVGSAQAKLHGASNVNALTRGLETGATGGLMDAGFGIADVASKPEIDANPIEEKTSSVVSKAGLPAGKSATSDVDVAQDIAKQNENAAANQATQGKQIQGNLQKGIRDYWTNVAKENGVSAPDPKLSIRDAGQQVGDDIIAQAKEIIKPLDDATGGKFSANDAALKSVNQQLQRVSSIEDETKLISEKQRLLWAQDDLLKQAKDAGIPSDTLDTFKAKYRTGQAIYDQNQHIRMTTSGLPAGVPGADADPEIVKSSTLLNRLVKDYSPEEGGKPGRLVQAGGEENAQNLLNSVSTAKVAENNLANSVIESNPDFSTLPPTDSNALREIVRPHVSAGKWFGTNADYKGILDDFDKMTPTQLKARFSNPSAVRQSLVKAQTRQTAMKAVGGVAAGAGIGAAGALGYGAIHGF